MIRRKNAETRNCSNCGCDHCDRCGGKSKTATKSNQVETARSAGKRAKTTTSRAKTTRSKNSK